MNVTAVLPEVVQKRGKEELLEHCTPTGEDGNSDRSHRKNFASSFHRCGDSERSRMSRQSHSESEGFLDLEKSSAQLSSAEKASEQQRLFGSPLREGEHSKVGFSPLTKKLNLSFGERKSCALKNQHTSPFSSTLLDTSTLTEDLRNMELSSSEDEEEYGLREGLVGVSCSEKKSIQDSDKERTEDGTEVSEPWSFPYKADKGIKRNITQSSSYPLFAVRPYHSDTKDISTKELEDTIRHSLSEANRQSLSPSSAERETLSLLNQKWSNQNVETSDAVDSGPMFSMPRSLSSSSAYYTSYNNSPPAPWMTRWKTRMCKFYPMGMCKNGAKCSFAHSAEELREPEALSQSHTANTMLQTSGKLPFYESESSYLRAQEVDLYGSENFGASASVRNGSFVASLSEGVSGHSAQTKSHLEENSSSSTNYGKTVPPAPWMTHFKTKMCKFFSAGECKNGDKCSFAHSMEELREPPPPEVNEERRRRYLRRQLQQVGMLNERTSRFSPYIRSQENPTSQGFCYPFSNVDYLRMMEHLSGTNYYDMYYRDIPKSLNEQSQGSGTLRSSKRNLMYSLSSPQLGDTFDSSNGIHRSSSYSFLEWNRDVLGNDSTDCRRPSSFSYHGDSNAIASGSFKPDSSYVGVYKEGLGRSMGINNASCSDFRSGPTMTSKSLNSSKMSDTFTSLGTGSRKVLKQVEGGTAVDCSLPSVRTTPHAQEEIWDEIDRDILHVVFDEDTELGNN